MSDPNTVYAPNTFFRTLVIISTVFIVFCIAMLSADMLTYRNTYYFFKWLVELLAILSWNIKILHNKGYLLEGNLAEVCIVFLVEFAHYTFRNVPSG